MLQETTTFRHHLYSPGKCCVVVTPVDLPAVYWLSHPFFSECAVCFTALRHSQLKLLATCRTHCELQSFIVLHASTPVENAREVSRSERFITCASVFDSLNVRRGAQRLRASNRERLPQVSLCPISPQAPCSQSARSDPRFS